MTEVVVTRRFPAAAAFEILAGLDLGADAANLYRPREPPPISPGIWAGPLTVAYRAAAGRLQLQAIGLRHATMPELAAALAEGPPGLRDEAGRRLARAFADALRRFADREAFDADAEAHRLRRDAFAREALADLHTLRAALYETSGAAPPPLTILDCPALGPAGRATTLADGTHVVAVSLATGPEHALIQVLHEQVHPVTDPLAGDSPARDTAVGSPGFAHHQRIERLALDVGEALVDARTPHRREAYARWMARFAPASG